MARDSLGRPWLGTCGRTGSVVNIELIGSNTMKHKLLRLCAVYAAVIFSTVLVLASVFAADRIEGRVQGGGGPIAKSSVTL